MRCKILCAGLLASVAAGAGAAVAADIPVRPAVAPIATAPPYVSDWNGFYVGIHGGGGWGHESFEASEFAVIDPPGSVVPFVTPPGSSASGGVFGFQFGHNWQWGPVVGGLEIDFSGADIRQTTTFFNPNLLGSQFFPFTRDFKIDELASARGRLGYLIWQNILVYGTAGIGWGHFRSSTTESDIFGDVITARLESNQFGWVAGAGVEWKFADRWFLRGEWLHYDFARVTNPNNNIFLNSGFDIDMGNSRTTVDVARAALSYRFGP